MSLANLFSPNDYDLFCRSISALTLESDQINIDDIDTAVLGQTLTIGAVRAALILIGRSGSLTQLISPLQFQSGTGTITRFDAMAPLSATGSGCIPNTAGFVTFTAQRINGVVRLSWRFSGVVTVATAASLLTIVEVLPAEFRPANQVSFSTLVIGASGAPLPVIASAHLPGFCRITAAGVIDFAFAAATHGSSSNWAIGENVAIIAGDGSYDAV